MSKSKLVREAGCPYQDIKYMRERVALTKETAEMGVAVLKLLEGHPEAGVCHVQTALYVTLTELIAGIKI